MGLFFISADQIQGNKAVLDETESRHLIKVLRKKPGASVELSDGQGNYYEGRLGEAGGRATVEILKTVKAPSSPPPHLILCPALLKNPRMDWLVEKAAELQAQALFPFLSERTVVKLKSGRESDQRIERWQKLALAALKQSKQSRPPQIGPPLSFPELLSRFESAKALKLLFLAEKSGLPSLKSLEGSAHPTQAFPLWIAMIGPEGGFTPKEIAAAEKAGFVPCSLGGVTLRAETAAVAVLAVLNYLKHSS